jgi:hypothetical protein
VYGGFIIGHPGAGLRTRGRKHQLWTDRVGL